MNRQLEEKKLQIETEDKHRDAVPDDNSSNNHEEESCFTEMVDDSHGVKVPPTIDYKIADLIKTEECGSFSLYSRDTTVETNVDDSVVVKSEKGRTYLTFAERKSRKDHCVFNQDVAIVDIDRKVKSNKNKVFVRNKVTGKMTTVGGEKLPWYDDIQVCLVEGKKVYRCCVCQKFFKWRSNLNRHMNFHTKEKVFECDKCGKHFNQQNNLDRHLKMHENDKHIYCTICGKEFFYPAVLRRHMEKKHAEYKTLSCDICNEKLFGEWDLTKHMEIHIKKSEYQCDKCGESFKHKSKLQKHGAEVHSGSEFKCKTCDAVFENKYALKEHTKSHWNKVYTCDECGKEFNHTSNLKTHKQLHGNEKLFDCDICGNVFRAKGNMQRHRTTHFTNENNSFHSDLNATTAINCNRSHSCFICKRIFSNQKELAVHTLYCIKSV